MKGETDAFQGVCPDDEWQVQQFGFSEIDHGYWALDYHICNSENTADLGLGIIASINFLENAGGRVYTL